MSATPSQEWQRPPNNPVAERDFVHVWKAELNQPPSTILALRQSLSADELARAKRFIRDRDRKRFVVGRSAVRDILSRYLQISPADVRFAYGDRGKPRLAQGQRCPVSSLELSFNLSHSSDLALVAVALGRQVGVDIEYLDPSVDRELLAKGSLTVREQSRLAALPEQLQLRAFFSLWTCKEALLKAGGEGLSIPLTEMEITWAPGIPPVVERLSDDAAEPSRWSLIDLPLDCDHVAAVAYLGTYSQPILWKWSPPRAS